MAALRPPPQVLLPSAPPSQKPPKQDTAWSNLPYFCRGAHLVASRPRQPAGLPAGRRIVHPGSRQLQPHPGSTIQRTAAPLPAPAALRRPARSSTGLPKCRLPPASGSQGAPLQHPGAAAGLGVLSRGRAFVPRAWREGVRMRRSASVFERMAERNRQQAAATPPEHSARSCSIWSLRRSGATTVAPSRSRARTMPLPTTPLPPSRGSGTVAGEAAAAAVGGGGSQRSRAGLRRSALNVRLLTTRGHAPATKHTRPLSRGPLTAASRAAATSNVAN